MRVDDRRSSERPNADDLRAKVFEDRIVRDDWRVEKMDRDGGVEYIEIFAGPNARQRAIDYARHRFGDFNEIVLEPCADWAPPWSRPISRTMC